MPSRRPQKKSKLNTKQIASIILLIMLIVSIVAYLVIVLLA
ncbi:MAG: hypothetical protein ACXQTI_09455 [Candidatus Nezhaarchaeales archaeon]